MHLAALVPGLGSAAAEAVAALYISCCCEPRGSGGSDGTGTDGSSEQRRQQLLGTLCGLLPSFAAALQHALSEAHGSNGQQARLLNAALGILGAAAKAADSQGQPGPTEQQVASSTVQLAADVALAAMQHPQFDVVLAALQHWDEQLERWKAASCGGSGSGAACSPQQQQALVGQLCSSLLQRMTLPAQLPTACLTADARDLPDAVQQASGVCGVPMHWLLHGVFPALPPPLPVSRPLWLCGTSVCMDGHVT